MNSIYQAHQTALSPAVQPFESAALGTTWRKFLLFAALHIAIGVAASRYSIVGTAHAWGTLFVGVLWAFSSRPLQDLACFASYVMGAEVLWRMTHAYALWEMGKYIVIAVLGIACLRSRRPAGASALNLFILLLLPSCLMTFAEMDFPTARRQVSFNISGPLAISVAAAFFSRMDLDARKMAAILRANILPIISIWVIVASGIWNAKVLQFGTESSASTSGGFGPNQVSIVFALGAMSAAVMVLFLEPRQGRVGRLFLLAIALLFGAQSMLTFSRSGLYTASTAIIVAVILTARNKRLRRFSLVAVAIIYLLATYVIFPQLDKFTGGALGQRFADTQLTGRDKLIASDLDVWANHPLLGVGPGLAVEHRAQYYHAVAAHCEVSRLLAEHGTLGFIALVYLCVLLCRRIRSFSDDALRGSIIACAMFALLFMGSNAMRIVAPSVLIGLAFANGQSNNRRLIHR